VLTAQVSHFVRELKRVSWCAQLAQLLWMRACELATQTYTSGVRLRASGARPMLSQLQLHQHLQTSLQPLQSPLLFLQAPLHPLQTPLYPQRTPPWPLQTHLHSLPTPQQSLQALLAAHSCNGVTACCGWQAHGLPAGTGRVLLADMEHCKVLTCCSRCTSTASCTVLY
jgi:hypothetical protein